MLIAVARNRRNGDVPRKRRAFYSSGNARPDPGEHLRGLSFSPGRVTAMLCTTSAMLQPQEILHKCACFHCMPLVVAAPPHPCQLHVHMSCMGAPLSGCLSIWLRFHPRACTDRPPDLDITLGQDLRPSQNSSEHIRDSATKQSIAVSGMVDHKKCCLCNNCNS